MVPEKVYWWMWKPGVIVTSPELDFTCSCGVTFRTRGRARPGLTMRCPTCRMDRRKVIQAKSMAKFVAKRKAAKAATAEVGV